MCEYVCTVYCTVAHGQLGFKGVYCLVQLPCCRVHEYVSLCVQFVVLLL